MSMLKWGPHSKWTVGISIAVFVVFATVIVWSDGVKAGWIDQYAWLYWKANLIKGLTQNPGYLFLILQTSCLGIIAAWFIKHWRR